MSLADKIISRLDQTNRRLSAIREELKAEYETHAASIAKSEAVIDANLSKQIVDQSVHIESLIQDALRCEGEQAALYWLISMMVQDSRLHQKHH